MIPFSRDYCQGKPQEMSVCIHLAAGPSSASSNSSDFEREARLFPLKTTFPLKMVEDFDGKRPQVHILDAIIPCLSQKAYPDTAVCCFGHCVTEQCYLQRLLISDEAGAFSTLHPPPPICCYPRTTQKLSWWGDAVVPLVSQWGVLAF